MRCGEAEHPKFDELEAERETETYDIIPHAVRYCEIVRGSGSGARTLIYSRRDVKMRTLDARTLARFRKLQRLQMQKLTEERRKDQALSLLHRVAESLRLSREARERAISLFLKALRSQNKEGLRDYALLAAACLLLAIRELKHEAPVTLQEVLRTFNECGTHLKPMKVIEQMERVGRLCGGIKLRDSKDYVWRVAQQVIEHPKVKQQLERLNMKPELYRHRLAMKALELLKEVRVVGPRPFTLALAAVYAADRILAVKEDHRPILTQRMLAKIGGISESTLREHYAKYFRHLVMREIKEELCRLFNLAGIDEHEGRRLLAKLGFNLDL